MYSHLKISALGLFLCLFQIIAVCHSGSAETIQVHPWTLEPEVIEASFEEPGWHNEVETYQVAVTNNPSPPSEGSPAWEEVGNGTRLRLDGLELVNGQDYYIHVRAIMQDSGVQPVGSSPPVKAVWPVETIGDAKGFPDNTWLALSDKKASRDASPYLFYIQEVDRSSGIMVYDTAGSLPSAQLKSGRMLSLAGKLDRLNNTLCLYDPLISIGGQNSAPVPLYVRNYQAGGGPFAYQPLPVEQGERGAPWGGGLNNMSLLIRTSGRVVELFPGFRMRITDGSTVQPIPVWLPFGEHSPSVGDYVEVTGHTDTTGIRLLSATSWKKLN